MHLSKVAVTLLAFFSNASLAIELPAGVPRSLEEFREKHPYRARSTKGDCRKVTRIRPSKHDTDDISDDFLEGIKQANNGGLLHLPKDELFVIGKPLDLTFLNDIHVRLDGKILFTDDVPQWQATAFKHPFQTNLMFWKWGGKNFKIYGDGVIDGNGERWWREFGELDLPADNNYTYARPILFYVGDAANVQIEGIQFKDGPIWHQLIERTEGISYRDVSCTARPRDQTVRPANTDFFNSLNVRDVSIERVWVDVGDDCFSPKSNGTNIHVNHMYCNGTHGQSLGSLGEHKGVMSYVEDVVIENVWMLNGGHGSRIKVWAGPTAGHGYVNNLTCSTSPDAVCDNIRFRNFAVRSPCGGPAIAICDGVTGDTGDLPCYAAGSAEAKAALRDTCIGEKSGYVGKPWADGGPGF
ncbi:exopolygalacturonase [Verticillium alfalfae VaMs.102]|uniref:galacturonan 1,4-alpha-galacturonidase n=1 Tax=Verticillium alfalfae (strain VaMs.102 / ATCC MYA-4576 / FGSC 10136) TaxID=526221 RepID=C9SN34_VERA1|nr:exopolygalacturonase [Verticillium alfalfae VaMs.102]EEY20199.1 exopolygalacturonase [Verticillium alfalfae VaMs.102]